MGTVAGTLFKADGTPATGGNTIQFKNRTTQAVTNAPVATDGTYVEMIQPPGTYDIGANGSYTDNNPSSIIVSTLPKYQNITSPHAV